MRPRRDDQPVEPEAGSAVEIEAAGVQVQAGQLRRGQVLDGESTEAVGGEERGRLWLLAREDTLRERGLVVGQPVLAVDEDDPLVVPDRPQRVHHADAGDRPAGDDERSPADAAHGRLRRIARAGQSASASATAASSASSGCPARTVAIPVTGSRSKTSGAATTQLP